ncbi:hypothetical protein [Erwinia billingiae]|uniref:hypothetical protein n=1 Tax=Erwinia billingiae TaxID=182337 RepID=UPI0032086994
MMPNPRFLKIIDARHHLTMPGADQEKISVVHYLQQVRKNIKQLAGEERSAVLLRKLSDGVISCRKTGVISWPGYQ